MVDLIGGKPEIIKLIDNPSLDDVLPSTLARFGLIHEMRGSLKYANVPSAEYRPSVLWILIVTRPSLLIALGTLNVASNLEGLILVKRVIWPFVDILLDRSMI